MRFVDNHKQDYSLSCNIVIRAFIEPQQKAGLTFFKMTGATANHSNIVAFLNIFKEVKKNPITVPAIKAGYPVKMHRDEIFSNNKTEK